MMLIRNVLLRLCFSAGVLSFCVGCRATGTDTTFVRPVCNEWLRVTQELVGEMCELATNEEAIRLIANDSTLCRLIREMGEEDYGKPERGWIVELSEEELVKGGVIFESKTMRDLNDKIPEVLLRRIDPSILFPILNQRIGGTSHLAASSLLRTSRTYIRPQDWKVNFLLILDYSKPYEVAAAFWESGTETVTGAVCFVPEMAGKLLVGTVEQGFGKKEQFRELSDKDLTGVSL